ncbi:hypothetical protein [Escherichia coli]|uniref:hypothetical protein n=1 Tax=Escherichia coli TaxID=562 RepID=UPI0032DBD0AE
MREILINESAWEDMTCLFAPSIALKAKYERNVLALADIIEYIDNATPIKVEDMLADDLIRELAERKRNSRMS